MSWENYHFQAKDPDCVKVGKMITLALYRLDISRSLASRMCKKSKNWIGEVVRVGKRKNMIRILELMDARIPGFMEQFVRVKKNFELEEK